MKTDCPHESNCLVPERKFGADLSVSKATRTWQPYHPVTDVSMSSRGPIYMSEPSGEEMARNRRFAAHAR